MRTNYDFIFHLATVEPAKNSVLYIIKKAIHTVDGFFYNSG
jgi:hypothetical protein